jgi:hypothetical protein
MNSVSDEIKREFKEFEEITIKEYFKRFNEHLAQGNADLFVKNYTFYIDVDSPNVKYFRKKVL